MLLGGEEKLRVGILYVVSSMRNGTRYTTRCCVPGAYIHIYIYIHYNAASALAKVNRKIMMLLAQEKEICFKLCDDMVWLKGCCCAASSFNILSFGKVFGNKLV